MKRFMYIGLSVSILLLFGQLWAQGEAPRPVPPEKPQLTEEQKAQIQDLRLQLKKEMLPLKAKLHTMNAELKLLLTEDKFDEGKVDRLLSEMASLRKQMQKKFILHQRSIRNILTPEQRKKFDSRILAGKWLKHKKRMPFRERKRFSRRMR